MHNKLFVKLAENFDLGIDTDNIIFSVNREIPWGETVPKDTAYWQLTPRNLTPCRNFSSNFSKESQIVCEKLEKLQNQYKESDDNLITKFVKENLDWRKLTILRTDHNIVTPHVDIGRHIAVNIGVKNSNTADTLIGYSTSEDNFWKQSFESFTMNDLDVYLVLVKNVHLVKPLEGISKYRYIFTYGLDILT